jgi:hypothetical protein
VNVPFAQFFYRVNPDKTIACICGFCFLPAAQQITKRIFARGSLHMLVGFGASTQNNVS